MGVPPGHVPAPSFPPVYHGATVMAVVPPAVPDAGSVMVIGVPPGYVPAPTFAPVIHGPPDMGVVPSTVVNIANGVIPTAPPHGHGEPHSDELRGVTSSMAKVSLRQEEEDEE